VSHCSHFCLHVVHASLSAVSSTMFDLSRCTTQCTIHPSPCTPSTSQGTCQFVGELYPTVGFTVAMLCCMGRLMDVSFLHASATPASSFAACLNRPGLCILRMSCRCCVILSQGSSLSRPMSVKPHGAGAGPVHACFYFLKCMPRTGGWAAGLHRVWVAISGPLCLSRCSACVCDPSACRGLTVKLVGLWHAVRP
jgi:hypothetical protein